MQIDKLYYVTNSQTVYVVPRAYQGSEHGSDKPLVYSAVHFSLLRYYIVSSNTSSSKHRHQYAHCLYCIIIADTN